jgi:hypothetical protein
MNQNLYVKTISGMERFNKAVEKYAPVFVGFASGYFLASILRALA